MFGWALEPLFLTVGLLRLSLDRTDAGHEVSKLGSHCGGSENKFAFELILGHQMKHVWLGT